jgi:hypothetical protein
MTAAQHERAVRVANTASDRAKVLFDSMGSSEAPRGEIVRAYRQAHRALAGRLTSRGAVDDALDELRKSTTASMESIFSKAQQTGQAQAEAALLVYGLQAADSDTDTEALALTAWAAQLEAQLQSARALALTGADESLILGDDDRAGVLTPGLVLAVGARWIVEIIGGAFDGGLRRIPRDTFYKQAIAAIDKRTTDCCLRVNGQTQPIDKPFKLTGTPRYADEIDNPPFHNYCRTAEALVLVEDANDNLTRELREKARRELERRK